MMKIIFHREARCILGGTWNNSDFLRIWHHVVQKISCHIFWVSSKWRQSGFQKDAKRKHDSRNNDKCISTTSNTIQILIIEFRNLKNTNFLIGRYLRITKVHSSRCRKKKLISPDRCWWRMLKTKCVDDKFEMLTAESLCWPLFTLCWWFSQCIKSVTNILIRSPTS